MVLVGSIRRDASSRRSVSRRRRAISPKLGAKRQLFFYLAADGRLVAACGFGSLGTIAKKMRFAEIVIVRRLAPKAEALADPAVNMKSLLL